MKPPRFLPAVFRALLGAAAIACSHAATTVISDTDYPGGTIAGPDTLVFQGTTSSISGNITNDGVLQFGPSLNQALTDNFAISGTGIVGVESGIVTLTNTNTYTGPTGVNGGTLLVGSGGSLAAESSVSVFVGGALGGGGTINGAVDVASGATLLAGAGLGNNATLTLSGDLALAPGSILAIGLGSEASTHDILARTSGGAWTFDPNQTVHFLDQGTIEIGVTYSGIITGLSSDPGVTSWHASNAGWTGSFSYSTGSVSFTATAVPESGTPILVGLGLTFLLYRKRRSLPPIG